MPGTLYIVATPIGNLEDMTLRAIRVLKEADVIAAEDTRHTRHLLGHFQIGTPLTSYHDHNKEEKAPVLVSRMKEGAKVALVCDAGTPTLSDPGYYLINQAASAGLPVVAVPGPSAVTAALSVAGLPTDAFCFEGFLPSRAAARRKKLAALAAEPRTIVLFEAPHRLVRTIEDIADAFGHDRRIAVCREMTKVHEEVVRGRTDEVLAGISGKTTRGEVTVVIEGARGDMAPAEPEEPVEERLRRMIVADGMGVKEASSLLARETGRSRRQLYALAVAITQSRRGAP